MTILLIQKQQIAIWSSASRGYVPKKTDEIFKGLSKVFGIADDILVVGYNNECKDNDDTL